jgi:thioredoxin-like negative regulator of GroEL
MNPLIIRIIVSFTVVLLYITVVNILKYINRKKLQSKVNSEEFLPSIQKGVPTLFYFWAPNCVQCSSQELYLDAATTRLKKQGNEFNIKKINAYLESETAAQFRVVTVPMSVVVDAKGKITSWNPGLMQPKNIISLLSYSPN